MLKRGLCRAKDRFDTTCRDPTRSTDRVPRILDLFPG